MLPPSSACNDASSSETLDARTPVAVVDTPNEELFFAAMTGDVERAAAALRLGADPNVANTHGITPLLVACGGVGPVAMLEALIAGGAFADAPDPAGWTPLTYAASSGQLALMSTLLAAGARASGAPGRRDDSAWTPLARAAHRGHAAAVRALLDAGALKHETVGGKTPLQWAQAAGHEDAVVELQ
jgi:ankyrin repeat protein